MNLLNMFYLLSSSCFSSLRISILASQWVSEDYTVTKSHGAVDRDLGTAGSLSSQDSLKRFCAPLFSHWRICLAQSCVCMCVCQCVRVCVCVLVVEWGLIDRTISWVSLTGLMGNSNRQTKKYNFCEVFVEHQLDIKWYQMKTCNGLLTCLCVCLSVCESAKRD